MALLWVDLERYEDAEKACREVLDMAAGGGAHDRKVVSSTEAGVWARVGV